MKNKGQALVEFIIILPILIIIILGIIDFSMIISKKNKLESILDDTVLVWKENRSKEKINEYIKKVDRNITLEFTEEENLISIYLKENYEVITPGLNKILSNPYVIKVRRVIYDEK